MIGSYIMVTILVKIVLVQTTFFDAKKVKKPFVRKNCTSTVQVQVQLRRILRRISDLFSERLQPMYSTCTCTSMCTYLPL